MERAQNEYKVTVDDGGVQADEYQKLCCFRTQCGLSVTLLEVLQPDETELEYEKFIKEHGASSLEKEAGLDEKQQELRKLFDSIKL